MSKKAFRKGLENFEGAMLLMQVRERRRTGLAFYDPTPEELREDCLKEFEALRLVWNKDPLQFERLEVLLASCLQAYIAGELDKGDFIVKDMHEIIWNARS